MKHIIALFTLVMLTFSASMTANAKAKTCKDFRTHAQAQAYYKKLKATNQTGWKSMDRNKDGVACEGLLKGKKAKKSSKASKYSKSTAKKSTYTKASKSTKASKYDAKKVKKDKKSLSKAKKAKMKAKMKNKKLKKSTKKKTK